MSGRSSESSLKRCETEPDSTPRDPAPPHWYRSPFRQIIFMPDLPPCRSRIHAPISPTCRAAGYYFREELLCRDLSFRRLGCRFLVCYTKTKQKGRPGRGQLARPAEGLVAGTQEGHP